MDPAIIRIIGLTVLISGMCWLISYGASRATGDKPEEQKKAFAKLFNKMVFWCLFVPVIGTLVGTLILLWLKSQHLI